MSDEQTMTLTSRAPGMLFLLLVLAAMVYAGLQVVAWLEDEQQVPVQKIIVFGEHHYIEPREIRQVVRETQPGSFFELDVQQVHQTLEAMPWVYRASVRKRWPSTLSVYLVEQEPSAVWNDDALLNKFGESFPAMLIENGLPQLFGPGGSEQTALNGYRAMQSLLDATGLKIAEVFLSERFAWHVRLTNDVELNLGRRQFVDRLQRFVDLYPLLAQESKALDYVDLRYDTGVAVGWKADHEDTNES